MPDQVDPEHAENSRQYSKGYAAGKRYVNSDVLELRREIKRLQAENTEKREERVYFKALELTLQHCEGWSVGKKPIKDVEGFSMLAKLFADAAIERL